MGFFAQFFTWLNTQLSTYIGSNTAQVAAAIEPAAITLATIYVMLWGWMNLQGLIQEQVLQGIKRILVMALILGIGIRLWLYNDLVVNTAKSRHPGLSFQEKFTSQWLTIAYPMRMTVPRDSNRAGQPRRSVSRCRRSSTRRIRPHTLNGRATTGLPSRNARRSAASSVADA